MTAYIIRRLLFLVFVLFGVSVLIFGLLMTFSPERRAAVYVTTPQQAKDIPRLVEQYGLNDPVPVQYTRWVKEVASGNLGWSLVAARPVAKAFWSYFPTTLELNLFASPLVIIVGIWLGTLAGVHRDTWLDHGTRIGAIVGWSLPTFLFALVLLMIFYGYFGLFPPGIISSDTSLWVINNPDKFTRYTGMYSIDGLLNGQLWVTWDSLNHLVLPVLTQVIVVVALLMRVMRSGMLEELSRDYVITAKAKGADAHTINIKHARKNALIPVITVAGQLVALSMEGSIAVEVVFSRQGMGWWLAHSATQLDMPVLMSVCMFIGVVFVLSNLIIDIMYAYIDPRIQLQ
ncbi:ABC transporter permease [Salidesulfovibrio onnuriiensis]|uniref:ABC transporter permease n=1 Tax=Salidesulfovibrio onnuriiensis TaxID=2583823 RepID=UPI0011CA0732|nr:ABC transporter permease [Salidesulfovibrio onnuriiensis]